MALKAGLAGTIWSPALQERCGTLGGKGKHWTKQLKWGLENWNSIEIEDTGSGGQRENNSSSQVCKTLLQNEKKIWNHRNVVNFSKTNQVRWKIFCDGKDSEDLY